MSRMKIFLVSVLKSLFLDSLPPSFVPLVFFLVFVPSFLLLLSFVSVLSQPNRDTDMKFSYMAGVVAADDRSRFERQLFRTTRGNCYVRFAEIEQAISDPTTGESIMKLVFIVFYKVSAPQHKASHHTCIKYFRLYVNLEIQQNIIARTRMCI